MYSYRGMIANLFMRLCSVLPLQDKVVYSSFDGKGVTDNPREIYLELKKQKPSVKSVWVLQQDDPIVNHDIVVRPFSFRLLYHLATAKLWIDNSRKRKWVHKRKGQYYVQTWHGDIAMKKIEKDAEDRLSHSYVDNAKHDAAITDLMISGSTFGTNMYRSSFWYKGDILERGVPKSTLFYQDHSPSQVKIRDYYRLEPRTKIALYCPTFRNRGDLSAYNLEYERMIERLEEHWGGQWIMMIRLHPKIQQEASGIEYNHHIINGSDYPSTSELVIASDLVITDYSSCMFDGMEAGKKVILYASDIEDYMAHERGMYFDIRNMPFPLAENMDSLDDCIRNFDEEQYYKGVNEFIAELGIKTNADTTRKVTEYIVAKVW